MNYEATNHLTPNTVILLGMQKKRILEWTISIVIVYNSTTVNTLRGLKFEFCEIKSHKDEHMMIAKCPIWCDPPPHLCYWKANENIDGFLITSSSCSIVKIIVCTFVLFVDLWKAFDTVLD